jgi:hypothetical protein
MNKESVLGANDNVLVVGKLGESLILPYLLTVLAVPVLDVTVLVAISCLSIYVNYVAAKLRDDYVLDVGNLSESLIGPYALTLVADPVLNDTGVVTAGSYCIHMYEKVATLSGDDYVLDVGKLSKSLILPYLLTGVADPVLDAAVAVTACLSSLHVNEKTISGSGKNNVLDVSKLGESLILPYSLTVVAYPVLDVAVVVASRSNSLEVNGVTLELGDDYALEVGNLGEILVCPCVAAIGAVPVLNVTGLSASSVLRLNVSDGVLSLFIGKLAASSADSVTSIGVLVIDLSNYGAFLGDLLGVSRIRPYCTARFAVPVLDVTGFSTGSILCLNVLYVVRAVELDTAGELIGAGKVLKNGAGSKANCYHCDNAKKQQVFPFHCERPP